jgi:hypothetical protein
LVVELAPRVSHPGVSMGHVETGLRRVMWVGPGVSC